MNYVWVAEHCIPYEGSTRIGVFTTREGGKAACEKHAAATREEGQAELRWRDNETFSYTPDYEVDRGGSGTVMGGIADDMAKKYPPGDDPLRVQARRDGTHCASERRVREGHDHPVRDLLP